MTDVTPSQLIYLKHKKYRLVVVRYSRAKEALASAMHALKIAEEDYRDVTEELLELEHMYDEINLETNPD